MIEAAVANASKKPTPAPAAKPNYGTVLVALQTGEHAVSQYAAALLVVHLVAEKGSAHVVKMSAEDAQEWASMLRAQYQSVWAAARRSDPIGFCRFLTISGIEHEDPEEYRRAIGVLLAG
jgi:hypothetical protein